MDLSSSYLGLRLASPVVPGASPLTGDLDSIRRLEDAGAPAVVLPSLFEEQVAAEALGHEGALTDPDRYLRQVRAAKDAVSIPVIASGGVSRMEDLLALRDTGVIAGAISGRALYDGAIDLTQALKALTQ